MCKILTMALCSAQKIIKEHFIMLQRKNVILCRTVYYKDILKAIFFIFFSIIQDLKIIYYSKRDWRNNASAKPRVPIYRKH